MRKTYIATLVIQFVIASAVFSQPHFKVKVAITDSTPWFEDVVQIGTYEVVPADTSGCSIGMITAPDYDRGLVNLVPRYVVDNAYVELQPKGQIIYHGGFFGRATFRLLLDIQSYCGSEIDTAVFTINPKDDSVVAIRPYGWQLTMKPDSFQTSFVARFQPTFDNNVWDSTLFFDFNASTTNGSFVSLNVFDSLTPILSYLAAPYERRKPLNLEFVTQSYHSFDTILFSAHVRNHTLDSIISYALPVTWVAPASVATGQSPGQDYALPNPFTTHTTIGFSLAKAERVKLQLFDITGQTIREIERECIPGTSEIDLDTRDVPSGCYWYVLHGGEWERSGKVVKLQP